MNETTGDGSGKKYPLTVSKMGTILETMKAKPPLNRKRVATRVKLVGPVTIEARDMLHGLAEHRGLSYAAMLEFVIRHAVICEKL